MGLDSDPALGDADARRLRAAAAGDDWTAVRDVLVTIKEPDARAFAVDTCLPPGPAPAWLTAWAAAEPWSALPPLLQGRHAISWAWEARGSGAASTVTPDGWRLFAERLAYADDCLVEAVARDRDDPTPWALMVVTARGRGLPKDAAERRFAEVTARHRWHVRAHEAMLQYRCAKWYGSHAEMHRFADETVADMPAGHPLGALVAIAAFEHRNRLDGDAKKAYQADPAVLAALHAAADRSVRHPAYARRPGWPVLEGYFALMFVYCGDGAAAADRFAALEPWVARLPFGYWPGPATWHFRRYRRRARALARRRTTR